jgi:hypothetical protein
MISDSRAGSWGVQTIKAVNRAGQPHRFSPDQQSGAERYDYQTNPALERGFQSH